MGQAAAGMGRNREYQLWRFQRLSRRVAGTGPAVGLTVADPAHHLLLALDFSIPRDYGRI